MSVITSGGDLVHYEVLGRGRAVILLHGCIGSWRYWVPTMQTLQLKYRCYALDMFGFGDTGKNALKYTLEHQIALIDDLMNELGMTKIALIGHDLGAFVGAEFARRYQDRVARLMLVSAPLFDPGDLANRVPAARRLPSMPTARTTMTPTPYENNPDAPTMMSPSAAMRAALQEVARAKGMPVPAAEPPAAKRTTDTLRPVAAVVNPLQQIFDNPLETLLGRCFKKSEAAYEKLSIDIAKTDVRAIRGVAESFDAGQMLDTLRLLPMPVVVVHGGDDPLFPQPSDDVWQYVTMDKDHLAIPLNGVRHFPMLEDERFVRLANDFLEAPDLSKLEIKERWRRRTR